MTPQEDNEPRPDENLEESETEKKYKRIFRIQRLGWLVIGFMALAVIMNLMGWFPKELNKYALIFSVIVYVIYMVLRQKMRS